MHKDMVTNAVFEQDGKDPNHYAITVNLYNYNPRDVDVIKKICTSISHEYLHMAITYAMDKETSRKADNGLLIKLAEEGYL
jgi:hypothetical protein